MARRSHCTASSPGAESWAQGAGRPDSPASLSTARASPHKAPAWTAWQLRGQRYGGPNLPLPAGQLHAQPGTLRWVRLCLGGAGYCREERPSLRLGHWSLRPRLSCEEGTGEHTEADRGCPVTPSASFPAPLGHHASERTRPCPQGAPDSEDRHKHVHL